MTTLSLDDAKVVKNDVRHDAQRRRDGDVRELRCAPTSTVDGNELPDGPGRDGADVGAHATTRAAPAATGSRRCSLRWRRRSTTRSNDCSRSLRACGVRRTSRTRSVRRRCRTGPSSRHRQSSGRAARAYARYRLADRHRPIFNLTISNVPGPPFPLYSAGARMVANYPMGPINDGAGLNITVLSYMNQLDFGVVTCRELHPRRLEDRRWSGRGARRAEEARRTRTAEEAEQVEAPGQGRARTWRVARSVVLAGSRRRARGARRRRPCGRAPADELRRRRRHRAQGDQGRGQGRGRVRALVRRDGHLTVRPVGCPSAASCTSPRS